MRILALILSLSASCAFAQVPGVVAKSYIVMDADGHIIVQKDAQTPRPIASISKLLVAEQLAPEIDPVGSVTLLKEDLASRKTRIRENTTFSEAQLLELALIPSNNQAIYALTRTHNTDKTIAAVNEAAQVRGLTSIHIEEPSGLSDNNHASAEDLAKFLSFVDGTSIASVSTETNTSYGKFHSTNPFLGKPGWDFSVSKTGFINAAGGCLATVLEIGGKKLSVVILGSTNTVTRWTDLVKIRQFISSSDKFWTIPLKVVSRGRKHHHH